MNRIIIRNSSLMLALSSALLSAQVQASGYALIENGASGQGNAYAGAAAYAEDASTVWFNPAGMMKLDDRQFVFAGHILLPKSSFTNGNSVDAGGRPLTGPDDDGGVDAFVANFFWVTAINDDTKFGLGVNSPFGLKTLYDDTWKGRYHAVESDLKTLNINPSIAYQVNEKFSVGGGVNLLLADVTLTQAVDFGALCYSLATPSSCAAAGNAPQQNDGFADLTADNFSDLAWGINLGLMYDITPATRLGVAWRSETTIKVQGDANFTVPASASFAPSAGVFIDTGLRAEVTLPQSFSVSLAHDRNKWLWLADVTWTGWSSYQELRIKFDNPIQSDSVTTNEWNDVFRFSVGADYTLNDAWTLRGGLAYDETPIPDAEHRTPRIPGNDRTWLSLGATYNINPSFIIDFGYSHLFIDDTPINNTLETTRCCLPATLNGTYTSSVDIISAGLRWNY